MFILYSKYVKELGITSNIESYVPSTALKATLETVSAEARRR